MGTIIEIKGLTKQYGALTALDDLNLAVEEGAVIGFLGPNGAGKTTTIRMLTGLARPTAGQAQVLGYLDERGSVRLPRGAAMIPWVSR